MEDHGAPDRRHTVVLLTRHLDGSGGVTRSVSNLANALAGAGLDVSLVALFRRGKPRYELDERIAVSYLRSLRPRALANLGPRAQALDARPSELCDPDEAMTALTDRRLETYLRELGPCTLVTHRPPLHQAAARWAPEHVVTLAVEHTSFEIREGYDIEAITAALPLLDRLVLLTDENREAWQAHLGSDDKLATIPNAVPTAFPTGRPRESWDAPVVVAAGTLMPLKGFDRLVRAFAPLVPELPAWRLRIFGRGSEREPLERLIEELGVAPAVELAGFTSALEQEMLASSVYAISSSSEGLPMVMLEAMSAALPVAAFDCSGVRELVDDGSTGLLAPQGDEAALTDALRRLMTDADLRRRFGLAGQALAGRYSSESVAAQWLALIEQLA